MKSGIIGSNQGVDPPRSQYISKKVEIPTHVGEEIARWMVQWEDNRRDKRMIEKLRTQLTKYQDEKSYLKKKHEKDMHEMLRQQEKIRRNATLKFQSSDDTKDQRYNKPTRRSNELNPNKKYSAMEMLGIRRAPISKSEVESSNKKKPITEDWRQKKIEERKQERKFEEQKQKREIEETKTNPLSLKRREDQQRRKEQGTSHGKRFADANMHTPIVPNQKRSSVTYTRNARRRNQSRWKIPVPDFCSIF